MEQLDDLIVRSMKYARNAGSTQRGHYTAAGRSDRWNLRLGIISVGLTAVVGTSIFADWAREYPVPFGIAALFAAGLGAARGTAQLAARAEAHRLAGARYGRLRRCVDMLRLRLAAGDVSRKEGLEKLDQFGEELSDLAEDSRSLSDKQHEAGKKSFKEYHPEYFESAPSHAGGVVIRRKDATTEFLIVSAKGKPEEWVLPKGHIEAGESAKQAARREVREETGVEAIVREALDVVEFSAPNERVQAQFFLMEAISEGRAREDRNLQWCGRDEAVRRLSFKEARRLICLAHPLLLDSSSNDV